MQRVKRCFFISTALLILVTFTEANVPFKKVSIATTTKAITSTTTTTTTTPSPENDTEKSHNTSTSHPTKNSKLTGIPQIDYIWDPNLPRELRGYNLSNYPFFATTPPEEDIHFKCDGLHDGFYASIEHKCQVYHHCVYGIRHDFLCANFTAFDQKTFICHFVSDVDCEGSQKYWNRNDNLYMATTTTSTTTTTTEPPPTPRRRQGVRPLKPLRRPSNRRPIDDYYEYDDEEYDEDYYEERRNRRRKQRPRQRRPLEDYDDTYSEKRSFSSEGRPKRPSQRDRYRDEEELEEDYDAIDHHKYDRSKTRNKPNSSTDGRKPAARKSVSTVGRHNADERRPLTDGRYSNGRKDKTKLALEDPADSSNTQVRHLSAGRRRTKEKNTSPSPAKTSDLEESSSLDQEEAAEEDAPLHIKNSSNTLEELVTPKAVPSSVYARPRAPPRIPRPVPINEKKKFQYTAQKTATTASPVIAVSDEEDYDDDEEYVHKRRRIHPPRRNIDNVDDSLPVEKRRNYNDDASGKKPSHTTNRRIVNDKRYPNTDEEEYDIINIGSNERIDNRNGGRKRPLTERNLSRSSSQDGEDADFIDEDYDERTAQPPRRLRPKVSIRKSLKRPRLPVSEEEEDVSDFEPERPVKGHNDVNINRQNNGVYSRSRHSNTTALPSAASEDITEDEPHTNDDVIEPPAPSNKPSHSRRPGAVRVVKRPFLPSRGGSPYLPRGLQPVGTAVKSSNGQTTDITLIDMGSTISGVRLLEHGAPIVRGSGAQRETVVVIQSAPPTTFPSYSTLPTEQTIRPELKPKITLDELYENDYDVTLNDALNPTLKPLYSHPNNHHLNVQNRNYPSAPAISTGNTYANNNPSPLVYHNNNNQNHNKNNHQLQIEQQNAYQPVANYHTPSQSVHQLNHSPPSQKSQLQSQSLKQANNNDNSDSDTYSTDIRRRAVVTASPYHNNRDVDVKIFPNFYDDLDY